MWMAVGQQSVRMLVRMRFTAVPSEIVSMVVVLVMDVAMRVPDRLMRVRMRMPLLQM